MDTLPAWTSSLVAVVINTSRFVTATRDGAPVGIVADTAAEAAAVGDAIREDKIRPVVGVRVRRS